MNGGLLGQDNSSINLEDFWLDKVARLSEALGTAKHDSEIQSTIGDPGFDMPYRILKHRGTEITEWTPKKTTVPFLCASVFTLLPAREKPFQI